MLCRAWVRRPFAAPAVGQSGPPSRRRAAHWRTPPAVRPPVTAAGGNQGPASGGGVGGVSDAYDLWAQHAATTSRVLQELEAMQRQMDSDFGGAFARAEALAQRAQQQRGQQGEGGVRVESGPGWQSYSEEHAFEERSTGSYRREYYTERVTVLAPQPAPLLAPPPPAHWDLLSSAGLLLAAFLAGAWAAATAAFNRGFGLTSYAECRRWHLLLLWPLLLLFSPDFRAQFWAAVRGQRAAVSGAAAGAPAEPGLGDASGAGTAA